MGATCLAKAPSHAALTRRAPSEPPSSSLSISLMVARQIRISQEIPQCKKLALTSSFSHFLLSRVPVTLFNARGANTAWRFHAFPAPPALAGSAPRCLLMRLQRPARVAEQTRRCLQHRLLATRRPSESYHGFRAANHGGGSLQGSIGLRCSFLSPAFYCPSCTKRDAVCGMRDHPGGVRRISGLLKRPQNIRK